MIGGRFARRVRRVGSVGALFAEQPARSERAVPLLRGNVEKPEGVSIRRPRRGQVAPGRVQQYERPNDVRVDERMGAVNRSINVRFGSQIEDSGWPLFG